MTAPMINPATRTPRPAHGVAAGTTSGPEPDPDAGPVGFVAVPRIVRRYPIAFKNPAPPPDTVAKDTDTMSTPELDAVVKAGVPAYPQDQYDAAVKKRIDLEIAAISAEAIALVDTMNRPKVTVDDYGLAAKALFTLHKGLVGRLIKAVPGADGQLLKKEAEGLLSQLSFASAEGVRGVKQSGGTWEKATVTKGGKQDKLTDHIAKNQIKFPGAQGFSNHLEETKESKALVGEPGIAALVKFCGITTAQLHWVVNALLEADREKPTSEIWKRWSALLDDFVALWPDVKPASAKDWCTKNLLPTGSKLGTHYLGMYAELAEARAILADGQLLPGTQLTMGKVKQRDVHGAMKQGAPLDQDIDLSFHHKDGTRHYVEVKADPATIVAKIGEDETKKDLIDDAFLGSAEATTPDQVLSYASAKKTHEAKKSKKGRYGSGKKIVLTYSTRKTKNWLCIFTSKAAVRLITHGFDLQLAGVRMDGAALMKVQDYVTKQTGGMSEPDKQVWVEKESLRPPDVLLKSL